MLSHLLRKLTTFTHSPGLPVVRSGGHVWHVSPAGMILFGPRGPQLEEWIASGRAIVVKANPARTVYRVALPGDTIFVKHCRITGPRAWGRELIRPPKARLEFDNAVSLRMRGVPAIEPLAWGSSHSLWPGESFLITRALNAVPFLQYLETEFPALPPDEQAAIGRQLTVALAQFFARLHDAGIDHPDPHPGNLLLEMPPYRIPRFTLLDLHAVHVGGPLSWGRSRANLVLFNRFFQLQTTRTERARFWRQYRRSRATLPILTEPALRHQAKELERKTHISNLHLWAKREARWLGSNRSIQRVKRGHVRGLAVRDIPEHVIRSLLEKPDAVFTHPDTRIHKNSTTSTVASFSLPMQVGSLPVILKRVNVRSWTEPLKNLFRKSAVVRSWANGHTLRDRGLPTPRPLAVFHRYRNGLPHEGYLLTELVPAAVPLGENPSFASHGVYPRGLLEAQDHGDKPRGSKDVPSLVRLARVLRLMHDRGISHRDLKAANILLAHGRDPALIDLVGVRTLSNVSVARRAKELARLNASFLRNPVITRTDRLRFLKAYLSAGRSLRVGWKSWWNLVSRATAEKVAKNRRSGRVLG
jgi:tRNA A-37 threonylcarbamoyl transferase component Bud32